MRFYADLPARRARQVVTDLAVLAWVALWVLVGRAAHEAVLAAAAPGHRLVDVGTGIGSGMRDAGESAAGVPLVGDELREPLDRVAGSGDMLRDAGQEVVDVVTTLATTTGLAVAVVPALLVVVPWALVRWRYARRAGAARALAATPAGTDLLALRALASRPTTRLTAVAPDPAAAWRQGDPDVTAALADLELARWGLRPTGRRTG